MTRHVLIFFLLLCIETRINAQKILYGINLDKVYADIKSEGTANLSKEVVLKDRSIFYSCRISFYDFVFSTVQRGFDPFIHPEKYYQKGLMDVKKVFGEPLKIFIDTGRLRIVTTWHPQGKEDTVLEDMQTGVRYPYDPSKFSSTGIPNTDFFVWRVKRSEGFFLIYYGLSGFGLALNIEKIYDEDGLNTRIDRILSQESRYRGKDYVLRSYSKN